MSTVKNILSIDIRYTFFKFRVTKSAQLGNRRIGSKVGNFSND